MLTNRIRALLVSVSSTTSNSFAGAGANLSITANMATTKHQATAKKARTALDEIGAKGEFRRVDAGWRSWVKNGEPQAKHRAESGRYHLYVAYACPWAHRALITRSLKGLEDCISVTVVMPTWRRTKPDDPDDAHTGWVFSDPDGEPQPNAVGLGGPFPSSHPGNEPDPVFGAATMREVYEKCNDQAGKYSVPVLFDMKLNTIVNNESSEIIKMLNSEFNNFAKHPDVDLNPDALQDEMARVDEWIYPTINNGVYRCGFAKSQEAYDEAIDELTDSFDRLEALLGERRFLCGDKFTLSDVRLFVTLLRFDPVYIVYFKTDTRSVAHSPNILNYCREVYQMPGVKQTVDMKQIKSHYFTSHPDLNKYSIIPRGSDFEALLSEPHNRSEL
mmetsp:Transcript_29766/g.66813  ORF Transcript_29766/g.66813 Transcript_29766/m.66813 type:complete len:388 (+) Transcript_29766:33-1196(+)